MADVLFRYLLAARAHDGAWYQRAFLADERLLAASVEKVIETAAFRVELISQHERVTTASRVLPASKGENVSFFLEPLPNPPPRGQFENRTERFPIASTFSVNSCEPCGGVGVINCDCGGSGRVPCERCGGDGRTVVEAQCQRCDGDGWMPCHRCRGRGFHKHDDCDGEGKVASWQEEIHTYSVKASRDALLPPDAPLLRTATAADEWLAKHDEVLEAISVEAVSNLLGYSTPELQAVVAAAQRAAEVFRLKAETDPEPCLFTAVRVHCVPVSACVTRSERFGNASRFWLIGRGEDAIEIRPPARMDLWKSFGWPGLAAGGGALFGLGLPLGAEMLHGLTALALAGLPVAGIGLKRFVFGSGSAVRTMAVIPCSGKPTIYLTCLPTLGSSLNRLEMRDHSFKAAIEAMMGEPRPPHQSQTIVLRTDRHEMVRLIEITQADRLSRTELARMMEAVNGVLFLEEAEHHADALRSEMHAATTARPIEARLLMEPLQLVADEHGLGPGGGVALEAIRRLWTRETNRPVDWAAVFDRLWSPVAMMLSGVRVPLVRRRRVGGGNR